MIYVLVTWLRADVFLTVHTNNSFSTQYTLWTYFKLTKMLDKNLRLEMCKNWTGFLLVGGIMCVCKNLFYIKPKRRINQPESHCSTVKNQLQSGQTHEGNYITTLRETADGDKE